MTRVYRQTVRADSADRTRRAILKAMDRRLRSKKPQPVSVDLIAQDAGVARSTVYGIFGSRAGLFDAYVDDLWQRSGLSHVSDAVQAEEAIDHLYGGILEASRMFAANLHVFRRLFAMDALDPGSLHGAVRRMEETRLGGMHYLADRLHQAGLLRDDISTARATDLLWTLCSFHAFDLLHSGRGMPTDDAARLLAIAAEHALCAQGEQRDGSYGRRRSDADGAGSHPTAGTIERTAAET